MGHTNYLIYFDSEDIDPQAKEAELNEQFRQDNVYRLNNSTSFVIKVSEDETFSEVQEKVKFSGAEGTPKNRGIIVEMLSGYRNGWYSRSFWDFLKKPLKEE